MKRVLAVMAAICAVAALPGRALAAGEPLPYAFDRADRTVRGAANSSDAPALAAGAAYKDTLGPGEKRVYRLDLDSTSDAYVSAVAVPEKGESVDYSDGITVTVQDRDGYSCSDNSSTFESAQYARPIAAYAYRVIGKGGSSCQAAGAYYVVVERKTKDIAGQGDWAVELRHVQEPAVRAGGASKAPTSWPSASPVPLTGDGSDRAGGTSFNDAPELEKGVWKSGIAPGQTLFYRVPVAWGQQLYAVAELGSSGSTGGKSYLPGALVVRLYNPLRGSVDSASTAYDGKQKAVELDPLPPVAYENRFGIGDKIEGMRVAGSYYLAVTLSPEVAGSFGTVHSLTLRVDVKGQARQGPSYVGAAPDLGAAGSTGVARSGTMRLVGVAGIGTGSVLVLGLGVWTVVARRRAAAGW
ncbi:hypothetical protein [Streptomyces sp. NBC_01465]|uniref:hypothetical protein n=1 Tax=Streptomyces sp. NBC_01465 TaxID=2903878 RepID=UPI002E34EAC6|nr:hypothetical protein [Streptomyces sp. NBC_01465]